jgi:hypothetical protein
MRLGAGLCAALGVPLACAPAAVDAFRGGGLAAAEEDVGVWSGDSTTVLFARTLRGERVVTKVMTVDARSGRTRAVATIPYGSQAPVVPTFSPDGRRIGIVVGFRLYVFDLNGRVVVDALPNVDRVGFSPAGTEAIVMRIRPRELYPDARFLSSALLDLATRSLRVFTPKAGTPHATMCEQGVHRQGLHALLLGRAATCLLPVPRRGSRSRLGS